MKKQTKNYEFENMVINTSLLQAADVIQSGSFAKICYDGIEKLPKKLGIGGVVTKKVEGMVQMLYSYESAVNNRIEKQGGERDFKAQGLPFGQWFVPNFLISHKGEMYMRFYLFKGGKMETTYYVDGKPATENETTLITAYKNQRNASGTQSQAGLTANQVKPCALSVKNLISLDCGTFHYKRNDAGLMELETLAVDAESCGK